MREPDNIEEVVKLQPDYLGFIFYERSPRFVKNDIPKLSPAIKKTGVFVNASIKDILEKVLKYDLQAVQLHGEESEAFCRSLQKELQTSGRTAELFKVFSIQDTLDLRMLEAFEDTVDLFLFDTKGKLKGGNGITFNWEVLKNYSASTPFFLSGGIGVEEVQQIKALYAHFEKRQREDLFFGIDVNSRFESAPGIKNTDTLKTFRKALFSEA